MTGRCIRGVPNSPVALDSCIGWVLTGPVDSESSDECASLANTHVVFSAAEDDVNESLKRFWEIESVGDHTGASVIDRFKEDIIFDGKRYVTKLPFKPNHESLPDNYSLCEKRLSSLRRRLEKDPKLLSEYHAIFKDYEENRIIERVQEDEAAVPGAVHYIPHRPIVRVDKETTKVRPVFDASAKNRGPSLNDCLYSGPNLLTRIFDILLRCRSNPILILSDIKQAFLHVGIHDEHKDFLRFLMFDPENINSIIIYRFLVAMFGVTSSTFLLEATLRYHCEKCIASGAVNQLFVENFLRNIYVDDSFGGARSVVEGLEWYRTAKRLLKSGGFTLRKWCTNSVELQRLIDVEEVGATRHVTKPSTEVDSSYIEFQIGVNSENVQLKNILGESWDIIADVFVVEFESIVKMAQKLKMTKRNLLRVSSSFYDPLGLISPVSIQAKLILQLLYKEKLDWDCEISEQLAVVWKSFIECLKDTPVIRIPRFINMCDENALLQLHGFCDSSSLAYCAAVYVRRETSVETRVDLVAAKTKVAPLKELTIPRLELLSCLLLVEFLNSVTFAIAQ